ncbi:MFS transporter [Streptomonospora alba]|uniref:Putative proline/betaine transporter n=1 Tax=Streptomonospora alba TaxID=183763 RepID=A0A0C2FE49_9ACTN|nr:MFS transporter [Streptomonospora alba]KIH97474.1 MFS transporter [Streptomonospora alba]
MPPTPRAASTAPAPVSPFKVASASFIGTAVEWYDYFIYGSAAAIVFGPLFFPEFSSVAGTLAAFATFSVGFFARPVGGVVMGHFGDRIGRKSMLVTSLIMMGAATFAIGLLPTYQTIGVWAPVLLVVLRFIQGLGVGGEWGGAVLMAVEHAPRHRRGFYGSFPQMGVPGGLILANIVFLSMSSAVSDEAFMAWGWRVPFLLSAVLVAVGLFIRFRISESPDFVAVDRSGAKARMPIAAVLRHNPKQVLLAAGAFIGNNTVGYIFMAYALSYTTTVLGLDRSLMLGITLLGALVWLVSIPWASALSDRLGRRRVLLGGSVGLAAWVLVFFPLIDTANTGLIVIAMAGAAFFLGATYGPLAALFSELFSARVRYSGASLGYQVGSILGGGLAPTAATALYAAWQSSWPITGYLFAVCLLSLACLAVLMPRRAAEPARD